MTTKSGQIETMNPIKKGVQLLGSRKMLESIERVMDKADKAGIKISGMEKIPEIVQGRVLFDIGDENYYQGSGLMNVAIFPDGEVQDLKVVSDQYQIVQHSDAILNLFNAVPDDVGIREIDVTLSPNGGRCFAKFTTDFEVEVKKDDLLRYQFLLENSADTTRTLNLLGGAWQMICGNGLIIPDNRIEQIGSGRKLHKNNLSLDGEIANFIKIMGASVQSMDAWKNYAKKSLGIPDLADVFERLEVGPRVQEELMELELRGQSTTVRNQLENNRLDAWELYSAFTQRITDSEALESVKAKNGDKVSRYFDNLVFN